MSVNEASVTPEALGNRSSAELSDDVEERINEKSANLITLNDEQDSQISPLTGANSFEETGQRLSLRFVCDRGCKNAAFQSQAILNRHIKRVHMKRYRCGLPEKYVDTDLGRMFRCSHTFSVLSQLLYHVCTKHSNMPKSLIREIITHSLVGAEMHPPSRKTVVAPSLGTTSPLLGATLLDQSSQRSVSAATCSVSQGANGRIGTYLESGDTEFLEEDLDLILARWNVVDGGNLTEDSLASPNSVASSHDCSADISGTDMVPAAFVPSQDDGESEQKSPSSIMDNKLDTIAAQSRQRTDLRMRSGSTVCPYEECDAMVDSRRAFLEHLRRHVSPRYFCRLCGEHHITHAHLVDHTRTVHASRQCPICGSIPSARNLRRHMKMHEEGGQKRGNDESFFICTFTACSKVFPSKHGLEQHLRRHQNAAQPAIASEQLRIRGSKQHAAEIKDGSLEEQFSKMESAVKGYKNHDHVKEESEHVRSNGRDFEKSEDERESREESLLQHLPKRIRVGVLTQEEIFDSMLHDVSRK